MSILILNWVATLLNIGNKVIASLTSTTVHAITLQMHTKLSTRCLELAGLCDGVRMIKTMDECKCTTQPLLQECAFPCMVFTFGHEVWHWHWTV